MKELLVSYAAYNAWANELLLQTIRPLGQELQQQQVVSSFPSLYATVLHLLDANSIWWQRLKLQEQILVPSATFSGSFDELAAQLQKQDRQWLEWIESASKPMLEHVFKYQNTKRESFKQPVWEMLQHLFNHGTYHRGQLVTLLRQLGVQKIPQTDYVAWRRKR